MCLKACNKPYRSTIEMQENMQVFGMFFVCFLHVFLHVCGMFFACVCGCLHVCVFFYMLCHVFCMFFACFLHAFCMLPCMFVSCVLHVFCMCLRFSIFVYISIVKKLQGLGHIYVIKY